MAATRPRLPGLEVPTTVTDADLADFLAGVKEHLDTAAGSVSNPNARYVTVSDLTSAGLANATVVNKYASITSAVASGNANKTTSADVLSNFTNLLSVGVNQASQLMQFLLYDPTTNSFVRISLGNIETAIEQFIEAAGSGSGTQQWLISGDPAELLFDDPNAAADTGLWSVRADTNTLHISAETDDKSTYVDAIQITRDGTAITEINLLALSLFFNGSDVLTNDSLAAQMAAVLADGVNITWDYAADSPYGLLTPKLVDVEAAQISYNPASSVHSVHEGMVGTDVQAAIDYLVEWLGTLELTGGGGGPVEWSDILDKPDFATVATSGLYSDLTGKPTIPTKAVQISYSPSSSVHSVHEAMVGTDVQGAIDYLVQWLGTLDISGGSSLPDLYGIPDGYVLTVESGVTEWAAASGGSSGYPEALGYTHI